MATLGGAGTMLFGFVSGSFPSAKANRLKNQPAEWLDPGAVQSDLDGYNEQLGAGLGLKPGDVLMLDSISSGPRY